MCNKILRYLLAPTTCLIYAQLAHAIDYGVGFSFSLDYGVASIYFSNGTSIDIAKIEGGPSYKRMMRATDNFKEESENPHATLHDASKLGTETIQAILNLQFPPWWGGSDARVQSLSAMLKPLNAAIESYLESSSSTVEVVFPFPVSDGYLNTLRAACSSLSLFMPLSAVPPAGILAARAHGIGGKCTGAFDDDTPGEDGRDGPEQLILTVDYSRAALTVMLLAEECGVFEERRVAHDTSLGVEGLSRGSDSSYADLTHTLHDIVSLPLEDGNGAGLTQISGFVVLGESAGDQRLENALKEVLGERFARLGRSSNDGRIKNIDPLFAASNGVAVDCWDRMNFQHYGAGHDSV